MLAEMGRICATVVISSRSRRLLLAFSDKIRRHFLFATSERYRETLEEALEALACVCVWVCVLAHLYLFLRVSVRRD